MKYLLILLMFVSFAATSQTIAIEIDFKSETKTRLIGQSKSGGSLIPSYEGYILLQDSCTSILFKTKKGIYSFDIEAFKKKLPEKNKTYKVRFYLEKRILKYEIM